MDKEKFNQIAKDTKDVLDRIDMLPEANTFAEIVTRIYNSENINSNETKKQNNQQNATKKQIDFLKQLGVDTENKTFSRKEARGGLNVRSGNKRITKTLYRE